VGKRRGTGETREVEGGGEHIRRGADVSHPARSPKVITVESKWLQNCVAQYKPGESWRRERITFAGSWLPFLPLLPALVPPRNNGWRRA